MATTYSSSAECGRAAGIKTIGAGSFPTETMIDEYRDDAYALIGAVIGHGTADSSGVAKAIEKAMGKKAKIKTRMPNLISLLLKNDKNNKQLKVKTKTGMTCDKAITLSTTTLKIKPL